MAVLMDLLLLNPAIGLWDLFKSLSNTHQCILSSKLGKLGILSSGWAWREYDEVGKIRGNN